MGDPVYIKEVAPRDGLQAQSVHLSLPQRQALIESLAATGLAELEIGSFVSPKAVPQMAGTDSLAAQLPKADIDWSVLVPNMKGYELARAAGISTISIVLGATEQMNQNNIRKSLPDAFSMAADIMDRAREDGVALHVYLSVAFECPYEGKVAPGVVIDQVSELMAHSPDRILLGDTIGAANPVAVRQLTASLVEQFGAERLGCHFHDTRAMALANVYASLESGIRHFDSSAGGLGGCPFAPGAKGNVATEDVVLLCEEAGLSTGVSLPALLDSVALLSDLIGTPQGGRSHYWLREHLERFSA
ncbi:MAG: hydroxymethylglutaryl-CoA lyase [Halieaceae bacterium]|jgi:hydroxymethylglutaryl-CoA lyase|nr:hydroxymethylglutaryl-CoA lyase [Halieaceae bacterium]